MSNEPIRLNTNQLRGYAPRLTAGDRVLLSGVIYTARDAAHKRFFELLDAGKPLPFDVKDAVIYYAGPTPGLGDLPVGACGPTTSGRMDQYAPRLLDSGLVAMIGKGDRDKRVVEAMIRNRAVYFAAVGGAGALVASAIRSAQVVDFPELGCESVKRMEVADMPLTVAIDAAGGSLYESGPAQYRKTR